MPNMGSILKVSISFPALPGIKGYPLSKWRLVSRFGVKRLSEHM